MKKRSIIIWLACIGLFLVHQLLQKGLHWECYFLDSFMDPFLSMPILLGGIQLERTFLLRQFKGIHTASTYQFTLLEIGVLSLFFSLLFEEGFPYWSAQFTRDSWDYLAYFLGSCFFCFFTNTNNFSLDSGKKYI